MHSPTARRCPLACPAASAAAIFCALAWLATSGPAFARENAAPPSTETAPAEATPEPSPAPEPTDEELRRLNPFRYIARREAGRAEAVRAAREKLAELGRRRAEALRAFFDEERLRLATLDVVAAQDRELARLREDLAAARAESASLRDRLESALAEATSAREAATRPAEERLAALDARAAALEAALEARSVELREADAALKKSIEEAAATLKKAVDDARAAAASADLARRRDIGWNRARLARDLEIVAFDDIEFVRIPAGEFVMGTTDEQAAELASLGRWSRLNEVERPARVVRISRPFFLARRETRQSLWRLVMGEHPFAFKGDDLPVESVTRERVEEFLRRMTERTGAVHRLPTEAEWEYCRLAGGSGLYGAGEGGAEIAEADLPRYGWIEPGAESRTHPTGGLAPNAWGLQDMIGNVWEWCRDTYVPDFYAREAGPVVDPFASEAGTEGVFRGGAYGLDATYARRAIRAGNLPDFSSPMVGFRMVREAP